MKTFGVAAFIVAASAAAFAQSEAQQSYMGQVKPAPVCLRPFDAPGPGAVINTHVVDPKTILFYQRDGKVWKNTLKTPCRGLMFHGFSYMTNQDELCSNAVAIKVIESGEVCELGSFVPYAPPQTANP